MTPMEWIGLGIAAAAGVVLSALFSGMETGLYTLNRVRLELRLRDAVPRARILSRLVDRPARMLAVVLVGTNAANYLGTWSVAAMLDASGMSTGMAILIDTVILVPVILLFGEILPKDLFRAHGDRWCYTLARPLRITEVAMTVVGIVPLVSAFGRGLSAMVGGTGTGEVAARQRMADLLKEGVESGVLTEGQTALLDRALHLRDRTVGEEMIPWSDVHTLDVDADRDRRMEAIASRWTRFPTLRDGRVQGVVSVLDLHAHPDASVDTVTSDVLRLRPDHRADLAVRWLAGHASALAVVEDTDGEPMGVVTLKDLVEPLTGDLDDL